MDTVVHEDEEIDEEALNERLIQRGYKKQKYRVILHRECKVKCVKSGMYAER